MVYSRKYCFKHLYMIKIPLVAFNQNETCYVVKYKVLLNVAKVSVIITMPTALWGLVLAAQPHVYTVCRQEPTSPLPFDKHIEAPQSARAEIQDSLCARLRNQANFIMVITQTATSTVKQQSPQSQNQTSTLNRHGNKHETPKPLNK